MGYLWIVKEQAIIYNLINIIGIGSVEVTRDGSNNGQLQTITGTLSTM